MSRLEVNGASIYYETAGSPDNPALLLIHAGIANLRMWDPQRDALAHDHYVIMYDSRGFGETTTDNVEFSDRDDARALLDHLGVTAATLIGCSRGGQIALDLTVETPERSKGVVVIGGGPSGFPYMGMTTDEEALVDEMDIAFEQAEWERLNRLEVKLWGIGPTRDEAELDPDFVGTAYSLNAANIRHITEKPTPSPLEPPSYDRLIDIDVPALVMVGELDLSEHLAEFEYLLSTIPRADEARFPNSALLLNMEHPEEFERVLTRWLRQHEL